jgi:hypothetical protein
MRRGFWVLIPALLLTGSACRRGHGDEAVSAVSPAEHPVSVDVTNNYALPVEIYAVGSGINQRLGTVHPGMAGHFVLPPALVGGNSVEFQARPTPPGNGTYRSGPLILNAGGTVDLVIATQLFNSTTMVRARE